MLFEESEICRERPDLGDRAKELHRLLSTAMVGATPGPWRKSCDVTCCCCFFGDGNGLMGTDLLFEPTAIRDMELVLLLLSNVHLIRKIGQGATYMDRFALLKWRKVDEPLSVCSFWSEEGRGYFIGPSPVKGNAPWASGLVMDLVNGLPQTLKALEQTAIRKLI